MTCGNFVVLAYVLIALWQQTIPWNTKVALRLISSNRSIFDVEPPIHSHRKSSSTTSSEAKHVTLALVANPYLPDDVV